MSTKWVVVAESSRAKFYATDTYHKQISEIAALVHPESRLHEGDLVSDGAGSDGGSPGQGPHVMNSRTSAKEHEAQSFARDISNRLESGRTEKAYSSLVLIAPPDFLGVLRDSLGKEVMTLVSKQVNKNLVHQSADVIRDYL